jgi:hypothetical protein
VSFGCSEIQQKKCQSSSLHSEAGAGFVYLEKSVCRFRVRAFGGGREF